MNCSPRTSRSPIKMHLRRSRPSNDSISLNKDEESWICEGLQGVWDIWGCQGCLYVWDVWISGMSKISGMFGMSRYLGCLGCLEWNVWEGYGLCLGGDDELPFYLYCQGGCRGAAYRNGDSPEKVFPFNLNDGIEQLIQYPSMPPKSLNERPKFISIEGNIGSGKSTILKIIRQNFPELTILDEPLTEWQNVGEDKNINLLGMYYQDPKRWGFTFQIYAFMSRINKWTEYSKMTGEGIRISERSLLSDRYIFASIMKDSDILDEAEHLIYLQFYDQLVKMNDIVDLFGVIYIQSPPEICAERIKKRSREGEGTIPLDYLQKIHQKHEQWLNKAGNKNLIIDNTVAIDQERIVNKISAWLDKLNTAVKISP